MYFRKLSLSASALGLALTFSGAQAQQFLSGWTTGHFETKSRPHTTVNNGSNSATFKTGKPFGGSTPSKIGFTAATFNSVDSGQPIHLGLFEFTNGIIWGGTGASTVKFHLGLAITAPEMQVIEIGTITFHLDHTRNFPGDVDDGFSATFVPHAPVRIQNSLVQFSLDVTPLAFQLPENGTLFKTDITMSFAPVPEPSTYAAWIAASSLVFAVYLRVRAQRKLFRGPMAA